MAAIAPGGPAAAPVPHEARLNKLWTINAATELYRTVAKATLPGFSWGVSVSVIGGPDANMRRIWYLALSAAFGRYRNAPQTAFQECNITSMWDLSNKAVKVEINFTHNALASAVSSNPLGTVIAIGSFFIPGGVVLKFGARLAGIGLGASIPGLTSQSHSATDSARTYLHRGPEQLTIGASWPDWLIHSGKHPVDNAPVPAWMVVKTCPKAVTLVPFGAFGYRGILREFPFTTANGTVVSSYPYGVIGPQPDGGTQVLAASLGGSPTPMLPDNGRIILTADKRTPNLPSPAPPIDGETRGSLLALVAQALEYPCFLPRSPGCGGQTLGTAGARLYPPTHNVVPNQLSTLVEANRLLLATAGSSGTGAVPQVAGPSVPKTVANFGG